jgi:hypothetical protein
MGSGCSGFLESIRQPTTGENHIGNPQSSRKDSAHGFSGHSNPQTANKPTLPRPLSRVVGLTLARVAPPGIDVGSKSSSDILRSNSFWSHEDDDRVDEQIDRWKAAEVLFLKVSEYHVALDLSNEFITSNCFQHEIIAVFKDSDGDSRPSMEACCRDITLSFLYV